MRVGRSEEARRWAPMASFLVAAAIALFVLPSALNIPQSNPSQTLEFAPIPPEDDEPPPPDDSNIAELQLAATTTAPGDALGVGEGVPPPLPAGAGTRPVTKRCVGNPARQTEDPLAPPCVAHFEGDNGGATHRGVGEHEIRILFYLRGASQENPDGTNEDPNPTDTYIDLNDPESENPTFAERVLRPLQRYFNDRYQTYGRQVHFTLYFDRGVANSTPETRRADASVNIADIDPFAVFFYAGTNQQDYLDVAAKKEVLNFGTIRARSAEFFQTHPGLMWSHLPSVEEQAGFFSDFICKKIVPYPTAAAGDVTGDGVPDNGSPRRLGLLASGDPDRLEYGRMADLVQASVEACGGEFIVERTYPLAGQYFGDQWQVTLNNMSAFQEQGITTIVWPGGYDVWHSYQAQTLRYFPEWVIAGDKMFEGYGASLYQEPEAWDQHALVVTPLSGTGAIEDLPCFRALLEGEPNMSWNDTVYLCQLFTWYEDLRQLFTGIQVAGPRLTPASVDRGFHAIPPHASADPDVPACFYRPADYSCVKDATFGVWDRLGPNARGQWPGCYRLANRAARFQRGTWPEGDAFAEVAADDPCLTWQGPVVER